LFRVTIIPLQALPSDCLGFVSGSRATCSKLTKSRSKLCFGRPLGLCFRIPNDLLHDLLSDRLALVQGHEHSVPSSVSRPTGLCLRVTILPFQALSSEDRLAFLVVGSCTIRSIFYLRTGRAVFQGHERPDDSSIFGRPLALPLGSDTTCPNLCIWTGELLVESRTSRSKLGPRTT
jgi:hypothetical protein